MICFCCEDGIVGGDRDVGLGLENELSKCVGWSAEEVWIEEKGRVSKWGAETGAARGEEEGDEGEDASGEESEGGRGGPPQRIFKENANEEEEEEEEKEEEQDSTEQDVPVTSSGLLACVVSEGCFASIRQGTSEEEDEDDETEIEVDEEKEDGFALAVNGDDADRWVCDKIKPGKRPRLTVLWQTWGEWGRGGMLSEEVEGEEEDAAKEPESRKEGDFCRWCCRDATCTNSELCNASVGSRR